MPRLTDTQSVLLATAARRQGGSLYPLPETLAASTRVAAAANKMLNAALVEERPTIILAEEHRSSGDDRFGLYVTPAGLVAIGIEPANIEGGRVPTPIDVVAPAQSSKASQVAALLSRKAGATLSELIEATGWLPHTARAALTGLRKRGHVIERNKRGDVTCYRIIAVEAA